MYDLHIFYWLHLAMYWYILFHYIEFEVQFQDVTTGNC